MNRLRILQGQLLGTQLLIRVLNSSRDLEFFISAGTLFHSFKPIENAVPMPYLSVHGILRLHLDGFLRLYGTSTNSKTPFINAISVLTLNISVISFSRFRWCKVVELPFLGSSSKDESKIFIYY